MFYRTAFRSQNSVGIKDHITCNLQNLSLGNYRLFLDALEYILDIEEKSGIRRSSIDCCFMNSCDAKQLIK